MRWLENLILRPLFYHPTVLHYDDRVRDGFDRRQIMRDEQVG